MDLLEFLRDKSPDFKGRKLSDIWNYNDDEIEYNHDFIQLIFPLDKPSQAVFNNIYLKSFEDILLIKKDKVIQNNILKSKDWFLVFLKRNNQWKSYSDHNQLRITRLIECLRLLISDKEADLFYEQIRRVGENRNIKVLVLKLLNAHHLDATSVLALEELLEYYKENKCHVLLCEVRKDALRILKNSGVLGRINRKNIFPHIRSNPTMSTAKAIKRAKFLLSHHDAKVTIYSNEIKGA